MIKKGCILKIILIIVLIICCIVYSIFKGLINMYLPFSNSVAKFVAERYVNEHISVNMRQIGKVDKNVKEGLFEIDFFCPDNRDIFFHVYVNSSDFDIFEDTYKRVLFSNIVHEKLDTYFKYCFGEMATYDVYFETSKFNDLNVDYANFKLSQINKFCENVDLYININYIENINCDEYDLKALKFINNCNVYNLEINKVFLRYYSKSKISPDYSYELSTNN